MPRGARPHASPSRERSLRPLTRASLRNILNVSFRGAPMRARLQRVARRARFPSSPSLARTRRVPAFARARRLERRARRDRLGGCGEHVYPSARSSARVRRAWARRRSVRADARDVTDKQGLEAASTDHSSRESSRCPSMAEGDAASSAESSCRAHDGSGTARDRSARRCAPRWRPPRRFARARTGARDDDGRARERRRASERARRRWEVRPRTRESGGRDDADAMTSDAEGRGLTVRVFSSAR